MSKRRLIVNADGYGFTPGVNQGIEECLDAGLVRSVSCTPNFGYLEGLNDLQREYAHASFGVHFNLSVGRPVLAPAKVDTLVDSEGRFLGRGIVRKLLARKVDTRQVSNELRAQCEAISSQGIEITHWDGHQNLHLYPIFFSVALEVSREVGIRRMRTHRRKLYDGQGPLSRLRSLDYYGRNPQRVATHVAARARMRQAARQRMSMADTLVTPGYVPGGSKSLRAFWENLPLSLPPGTHEIYCHPAIPDEILRTHSNYVDERLMETRILSDRATVALYSDVVELISFREI